MPELSRPALSHLNNNSINPNNRDEQRDPPSKKRATRHWGSVEHHVFVYRGRCLVFNIESLDVHRLDIEDKTLLEANPKPDTPENWYRNGVDHGLTLAAARKSFDKLKTLKIILPEGRLPSAAKPPPEAFDYTFMVNVSQTCNLRCAYCYTNEGSFDFKEVKKTKMSEEDARKLVHFMVKQYPKSKVCCFHFYGGEPLINFGAIRALVEETDKVEKEDRHFEFAITTNGTLLSKEVADFMDRYHFTVFFSIDGPAKVHDKFRIFADGNGSYDLVKKNLDYLLTKKNVKLVGSSVIRSGWTLPEAEKFLTILGVDAFKAERTRVNECDPLALAPEEHDQYMQDLDTLFDIYVDALRQNKKPLDYRLSPKILQLWTKTRRTHFCPAGERMFGITAEGEIYPCSLHSGRPQSYLGNVDQGPDTVKTEEFRKRISSDGQEVCQTCWNRNLCGGGCSAMVDRFGHEECDILRKKAEIAIAIYDQIHHEDELKLLNLVSPKTVNLIESSGEGKSHD